MANNKRAEANLRSNVVASEPDDPKFKEQLAKMAFFNLDEKKIEAFRNKGLTPTVRRN